MKNLPNFSLHAETFDSMKTFQNLSEVTTELANLRSKLTCAIQDYNFKFIDMNRKCSAYFNNPGISRFEIEYFKAKNECDELAENIRSLWSSIITVSEVYERFVNKKIEKMEAKLNA